MSSNNAYSKLYEAMLYFHSGHHQQLLSMQQQCKQATSVGDLHRLASDIDSFCYYLHNHHTIEDKHVFPLVARKTDISHLEAHHEQLTQLLADFKNCSNQLKQLTSSNKDISVILLDTTSLVNKVATLVNEHERAEEQVIAPDNMKKWFTESEMKQLFPILLPIIISAAHKPCCSVTNPLACNTSVFVATFQLNSLIGSVYGFYQTSSEYQPVCIFRALWRLTSIAGTCYSYALQSINRHFFAVFYKYQYLVTFRVHWYMIVLRWIISIGISTVFLASPDLLGFDKEVRFCSINVKLLKLTVFGLVAGLVVSLCSFMSIYGVILYRAYKSSRQISNMASHTTTPHVPNAKREVKLAKSILILAGIFGSGGILFMIIICWQILTPMSSPLKELHLFSTTVFVISCTGMMVALFSVNTEVKDVAFGCGRVLLQSILPTPVPQRIASNAVRKL
ncbi:unnamed protein product [Rotaria magnacalcarata]|uniref:Hemerythrin-like domain-containing protein n=2 Tax=Rotaria magnacalcarata TaxID=392030 RepID=A0A816TPX6_9BILA|nr:unnamed protein product [Rotaria magnacalcarata]